jgi:hypothetical protein
MEMELSGKTWKALAVYGLIVAGAFGIMALSSSRIAAVKGLVARAKGQGLIVDAADKSFGDVAPGETRDVHFTLTNVTNKAVRIVGVSTSCTCTAIVQDVPLTIDAGMTQDIVFKVNYGKAGIASEMIYLYTDFTSQQLVRLKLSGSFLE